MLKELICVVKVTNETVSAEWVLGSVFNLALNLFEKASWAALITFLIFICICFYLYYTVRKFISFAAIPSVYRLC